MPNNISVFGLGGSFGKFEREAAAAAEKALKILKKKNVSMEIYLAKTSRMRFLNRKFRKKDKPANVLSFEEPKGFARPESKNKNIGEIYVKVPPTDYSVSELLVHGLLHLLGYGHENKKNRIKMEKTEKSIAKKLNF